MSEIRAQKLTFVSEVVKDWKPEEIEAFGELFEKFISGYEDVFQARIKDIVGRSLNGGPFPSPRFALWAMRMSQSTFTILLGGELQITDRLRDAISDSRFIAADGGMRHAAALGVVPELWVGDFDSTPTDLAGAFPAVPRQPYPAAKASTDGEIAVSEAIARGAKRLVLAGALAGERSDHAIQHLLYAVSLAEQGYDMLLTSGREEAVPLIAGKIELDLPPDSLFSVPGLSELHGPDDRKRALPACRFPFALRLVAHHFQCRERQGALQARERPSHCARPPL